MTTYTPGPWQVANLTTCPSISAASGSVTLLVDLFGNYRDDPQIAADAALIAAAPELLEALSRVTMALAWHEARHGVAMDRAFVEEARAAIAKATGGAA